MRILQATGAYPPTIGGGPNFTRDLTAHLRERGHEVPVVTTEPDEGDPNEVAQDDVGRVYRAPARTVAGAPVAPSYPTLLNRVIRRVDPDVVHGYYPLPFYPDVAAGLARAHDVPFVLTCFGAWESTLDSVIGTLGFAYNNTLLRTTLGLTDAAHTLSPNVLTDIDTYDGFESLFEVIPQGVDTDAFDPGRVTTDPPFESDAEYVLLFVGVFRRYKGLPTLVRALSHLREEYGTDASVALVGEGPEEGRVRSLVAKLGLEGAVEFPGHVTKAEVLAAYDSADAFVLPSPTIQESFGVVSAEALSMGTPVVATSGSGSGSYLQQMGIGTVVPPEDPAAMAAGIHELLSDRDRHAAEAERSRPFAEEHLSWDRLTDRYVEWYESVV